MQPSLSIARRLASAACILTFLLPVHALAGAIFINELRINQPSTDVDEYFELLGPPGGSLDGLTYVVIGDGAGGSGVIEEVLDLTGNSLDANGYFVAAEGTFSIGIADLTTSLNFENSDNVTHLLVSGFSGSDGTDLDTDDDGVLDSTPWTAIVDDLALFEPGDEDLIYSSTVVGPDGSFVPGHAFRCPDGGATFVIGIFGVPGQDTPGGANDCTAPTPLTIPQIQGASHTSPELGTLAVTSGVVTTVVSNGFYLQDPAGDGDTTTSDGIFVFTSSAPTVSSGDLVEVTGGISEFQPGPASAGNLTITQISSPTITTLSTGNPLPAPVVITAADIPDTEIISSDDLSIFNPAVDPIDFYETFEGMRVTIEDPVAVSGRDRFNETYVLASNGAGATGRTPRGGIALSPTDFNPERIELQIRTDLTPGFDPVINVGDTLSDVTGPLDYRFGFFEVLVEAPFVVTPGGLAPESTSIQPGPDVLTVAAYNVFNLDPLLEDPALCEDGVDDIDDDVGDGRFDSIAAHIVSNLNSPDIIALQEIQDDNGCEDDGTVTADVTFATLIGAISLAGGPTYAYLDLPPMNNTDGGQPGGNIRVGYLFNASRVILLAADRIVDRDLSDGDAFFDSRKPMFAAFDFNGEEVAFINVHFSSKGGGTPLFGIVQPDPVNGSVDQRIAQATEVNAFVDDLLSSNADAKIVVLGDFNEFDWDASVFDPLTGAPAPVLEVLSRDFPVTERYSFNFNGNSQALDHILVTPNLRPDVVSDFVHVNSEFSATAARASDHDPVIVSIEFPAADSDGDGIDDDADNCIDVANPGQDDSNNDGLGNECDPDIGSLAGVGIDDCVVGFPDLGFFKDAFFSTPASANWNPDADLVVDGSVGFADLARLKEFFFGAPGPSGVPNACP